MGTSTVIRANLAGTMSVIAVCIPLLAGICFVPPCFSGDPTSEWASSSLDVVKNAARGGNASAQWYLGYCCCTGQRVEKDWGVAFAWFRKAADQGNKFGQNDLGTCYYTGQGVEKNLNEAVKWYRLAANNGHPLAAFSLGYLAEQSRDVDLAKSWYSLAMKNGHPTAASRLQAMASQTANVDNAAAAPVVVPPAPVSKAASSQTKSLETTAKRSINLRDVFDGIKAKAEGGVPWLKDIWVSVTRKVNPWRETMLFGTVMTTLIIGVFILWRRVVLKKRRTWSLSLLIEGIIKGALSGAFCWALGLAFLGCVAGAIGAEAGWLSAWLAVDVGKDEEGVTMVVGAAIGAVIGVVIGAVTGAVRQIRRRWGKTREEWDAQVETERVAEEAAAERAARETAAWAPKEYTCSKCGYEFNGAKHRCPGCNCLLWYR